MGLFAAFGTLLLALAPQGSPQTTKGGIHWQERTPLPEARAGAFVGVSGDALLVAGGARHGADGVERASDRVWILSEPTGTWRELDARLPAPRAHGLSLDWDGAVLCIGGTDGDRPRDEVTSLRWNGNTLEQVDLPALPSPTVHPSGGVVDGTLYVAAAGARAEFWSLDLGAGSASGWTELDPWNGPARRRAVVGVQGGSLYLIGGIDPDGAFLTDVHCFTPGAGWSRHAEPPRPVAGAPGPALAVGPSHLLVLGGETGTHGPELGNRHPGYARDVLAYHTLTDTWRPLDALPWRPGPDPLEDPDAGIWPPTLTSVVEWPSGEFTFVGGRARPGVETARVFSGSVHGESGSFGALDTTVLGLYFAVLVGMGVWFARRGRSTEEFFLAGGRVPWWAAGLSIYATTVSAITFMAIPAKSFATDWVWILGHATIPLVAPLVAWFYLPAFRRRRSASVYALLEERFGAPTRMVGSAAFLLFQLGRLGIVLYLPALALSSVTGIDTRLCIVAMGLLVTAYAVLGGIEAVIWTDVLQVIVLVGGALFAVVVIVVDLDIGVGHMFKASREWGKLRLVSPGWSAASTALWVVVLGNAFISLVTFTSDQSVIQRYLTTADEGAARRSIWTNALMTIPSAILFFSVGTALWCFYRVHRERLDLLGRTDDIFPWFIANELPAGVCGLVIAGLFAAAMSSLDSSLNSMATVLTTDLHDRIAPAAVERRRLRFARLATAVLGLAATGSALAMAGLDSTSTWDEYTKVIGLFGGGLAGLFALAVFGRGANGVGALAGFAASAAVLAFVQRATDVHFFLYAAIGWVTCFVVGEVVGRLTGGARPNAAEAA